MNKKQATNLVRKFAEPYLQPFAKKLPEMVEPQWINLLLWFEKLPEKKASEILMEFIRLNPPKILEGGKSAGTMPDFGEVKGFLYNKVNNPQALPSCPCCDNTRWVCVGGNASRCDCVKGKLSENCRNPEHCNSTEELPCPLGSEHYQEKKSIVREELESDPAYELGKSFLKGRGKEILNATEERTKKMERAIPGVGEDGVPWED